ncbi:MAG: hypothetical protein QOG20_5186 [Pseudonocardiales bacterium]|jgi:hypothetical protein|nr:hypothetical protein [Pseudonocardiales bacterium]
MTGGPGPQQLTWAPTDGRWAVVVMNTDGGRPVVADLSAGVTAPGLHRVWIGLFVGAGIAVVAGAALVAFGASSRSHLATGRSPS